MSFIETDKRHQINPIDERLMNTVKPYIVIVLSRVIVIIVNAACVSVISLTVIRKARRPLRRLKRN